VKRSIIIELMEEHSAANFYTIRFKDESESGFDQFISQFDVEEYENDVDAIVYWMDKIGALGALERHFKPEGHPRVGAIPIPPPSSRLRLYCFRMCDEILILGGGGMKQTRSYQQDPVLMQHVTVIKRVGLKLLRSVEKGTTFRNGKYLSGRLEFEIDI
jgi:hypothetical protein